MKEAFLIIISILAASYAFWTKQTKVALGFLVLAISFVFIIPGLTQGILVDIFGAISLIIFLAAVFLIVWKKKENE